MLLHGVLMRCNAKHSQGQWGPGEFQTPAPRGPDALPWFCSQWSPWQSCFKPLLHGVLMRWMLSGNGFTLVAGGFKPLLHGVLMRWPTGASAHGCPGQFQTPAPRGPDALVAVLTAGVLLLQVSNPCSTGS